MRRSPYNMPMQHRGRQRYGSNTLAMWHQKEMGGWHHSGHFTTGKEPAPVLQKAGWASGPPLSLTVKVNTDRNNVPYTSTELLWKHNNYTALQYYKKWQCWSIKFAYKSTKWQSLATTGGCWRTLPRAVRQQLVKFAEHWNGLVRLISWITRAQK
jgi:hypothetical protein